MDFWGPGLVNPNFVLGVEMAKPNGWEDVSSAVKSIAGGWDFLMGHGVLPRYRMWFIEAGSALAGRNRRPLSFISKRKKPTLNSDGNMALRYRMVRKWGIAMATLPAVSRIGSFTMAPGLCPNKNWQQEGIRE